MKGKQTYVRLSSFSIANYSDEKGKKKVEFLLDSVDVLIEK